MDNVVVVDTSVLISALIGTKGPNREIIRRCLQGIYKPLISNALFQEYEDVSYRQEIQKKCPLSNKEVQELLNSFYRVCNWVAIYYLWRPNLGDESDNFLIELALAGNAKYIITNNIGDLLNAQLKFPGLKIIKPENMLKHPENTI